jgi:hypothetical protein
MGWSGERKACFEWGTAAKDKMDAEGRLVVGELAAGASSRWAGHIDIADSARRETDGQARWCGEGKSVHVPFLAASRAERE